MHQRPHQLRNLLRSIRSIEWEWISLPHGVFASDETPIDDFGLIGVAVSALLYFPSPSFGFSSVVAAKKSDVRFIALKRCRATV